MDTSNPAVMVNGEYLRANVGKRVRCVLKLLRGDNGVITAQTSDSIQVSVRGSIPPALSLTQYFEVIGIAETDRSIRADVCTSFGDKFDMASYNQLCQLINTEHSDLFI